MSFEDAKTPKYPVNKGGFAILNDESPMPFGKHQGEKMGNVPADYLLWLEENNKCSRSVQAYITDNRAALMIQAGKKPAGTRSTPVRTRWRG